MAKSTNRGFLRFLDNLFVSGDEGRLPGKTTETAVNGSASSQNGSSGDFMDFIKNELSVKGSRKAKYSDFDELDQSPLPSQALNIYASLVTQGEIEEGEESSTYRVVTKNQKQKEIFEDMENRTDIKRQLFGKVRSACKYGISPQEVVFKQFHGITKFQLIKPSSFHYTNPDGSTDTEYPYSQRGPMGEELAKFKKFQVCNFVIDGDESRIYGKSVLETIRKTSKIIDLLETSMAFRELHKAMQRWLWKIDSTGLDPQSAFEYSHKVMARHNKPRYIDANGNLNLARTPIADQSDIALPTYKDGADVGIEGLPRDNVAPSLEVLQHFMSKFFGGIAIPNYYFSFEGKRQIRSVSALTYTDILLARIVFRLQSAITSPMWDVYNNESQFHGIEDDDFKLVFPVIGTVDELIRYQILNLKVTIANQLRVNMRMVDDDWVYSFLKFSEQDATRLKGFRELVKKNENQMIQDAADGVFIQPVTTWGVEGEDSAFDVITPAIRQMIDSGQLGEGQKEIIRAVPGKIPAGINEKDSILPRHKEVIDAASHKVEAAQMRLIQERMNSERTFQALLADSKISKALEDINELAKMRLGHDDPFNTGEIH